MHARFNVVCCVSVLGALWTGGCKHEESLAKESPKVAGELRVFAEDTAAATILDIVALPHGDWATLNEGGTPVTIYDSSRAAPIEWIGRRGAGPGDLRSPLNFVAGAASGTVLVWDAARRAVVAVDVASGAVHDAFPVPVAPGAGFTTALRYLSPGTPERLSRSSFGLIYELDPAVVARPVQFLDMSLLVVGPGSAVGTLYRPSTTNAADSSVTDMVEVPLWSVCPSGTVVVFDPGARALFWWRGVGDSIGPVAVGLGRQPRTEGHVRAYMRAVVLSEAREHERAAPTDEALDEMIGSSLDEAGAMMADSLPAIGGLICDAEDRALINVFNGGDLPLGHGPMWVRVSSSGRRDALRLPEGFYPMGVSGQIAVGIYSDDTGLERLATVVLPE